MTKKYLLIFVLVTLLLSACAGAGQASPTPTLPSPAEASPPAGEITPEESAPGERTLSVMTHDSFAVSEEVVAAFEQENNVTVRFLEAGDAGTALNQAILSKNNPLADVLYGVDNTFLSRALDEVIFETYESPLLADIPDPFKLDPEHRALPVDFGDVCLNYDKSYFDEQGLAPPQNLDDLLKPEYQGLLVVENPARSSPGLAFLLATVANFGQDGYLDYWSDLVANDVLVVNDWETAYNSEFSEHGGSRPIVVSYGSSPPAEVIFASQPLEDAPTAAVTGGQSCFRQIEFVGILAGTQNRDLAEKWIDFMLSPAFQADMPLQMFVYPVNPNAEIDETFAKYAVIPEETATLSPEEIAANREQWIRDWNETVLR